MESLLGRARYFAWRLAEPLNDRVNTLPLFGTVVVNLVELNGYITRW